MPRHPSGKNRRQESCQTLSTPCPRFNPLQRITPARKASGISEHAPLWDHRGGQAGAPKNQKNTFERPTIRAASLPDASNAETRSRKWSWRRDLNPRPSDYKSDALPAELRQPFPPETAPGILLLIPQPRTDTLPLRAYHGTKIKVSTHGAVEQERQGPGNRDQGLGKPSGHVHGSPRSLRRGGRGISTPRRKTCPRGPRGPGALGKRGQSRDQGKKGAGDQECKGAWKEGIRETGDQLSASWRPLARTWPVGRLAARPCFPGRR